MIEEDKCQNLRDLGNPAITQLEKAWHKDIGLWERDSDSSLYIHNST